MAFQKSIYQLHSFLKKRPNFEKRKFKDLGQLRNNIVAATEEEMQGIGETQKNIDDKPQRFNI